MFLSNLKFFGGWLELGTGTTCGVFIEPSRLPLHTTLTNEILFCAMWVLSNTDRNAARHKSLTQLHTH